MGIDILVPVLSRPQNVQPLLESLAVTGTPYRVFFICSPLDKEQIEACRATNAETLVVDWQPNRGDYAKKINWAFGRTDSEWVFSGADDLRFQAEWDTLALDLASKSQKSVIGTNDLHNPSVQRRMASTHTLFRRSYIEEYGGTEDDSGRVLCELYDHQFVDTEFVGVARTRGVWAFSKYSIVEHLHPHWGNAEWDATYRKAIRATNADYRLYRKRRGELQINGRATRRAIRQKAFEEKRWRQ